MLERNRILAIALTLCLAFAGACSGAESNNGDNNGNNNADAGNDVSTDDTGGDTSETSYDGLVINELTSKGDPNDWFELYNASDSDIDLSGVFFTDDIAGEPEKGVFSSGTVPAGGYFVKEMTEEDPGFKLGGDEELAIIAPNGDIIDQVDWDDGDAPENASYGRIPNGSGDFKTLTNVTRGAENMDNTGECGNDTIEGDEVCDGTALDGEDCAAQGFDGGDLACASDCTAFDTSACTTAGEVVINEVASKDGDKLELFNRGGSQVDISGWYYGDDDFPADDTHKYVIDSGTTLDAGAYIVFEKDTHHDFGFGGNDAATLFDADDNQVDQADWGDDEADTSYCRIPNGTGDFKPCSDATFGAENMDSTSGTPMVVINEVSSKDGDKLELYNAGDAEADISGWYYGDDAFPGDDTHKYTIAADTTLAAGAYIVFEKDTHHDFGLGGDDAVTLFDADDNQIDMADWPDGDADTSYCRMPNGTGDFQACATATFGAEN
jgi:hypothetical protein